MYKRKLVYSDGILSDDTEIEMEDAEAAMNALQIDDEVDENGAREINDDGEFSKDCLTDIWARGWEQIDKMNVKEMMICDEKRVNRKRATQKMILQKVKEMKEAAESTVIIDEEYDIPIAPLWTMAIHSLDPARYLDV